MHTHIHTHNSSLVQQVCACMHIHIHTPYMYILDIHTNHYCAANEIIRARTALVTSPSRGRHARRQPHPWPAWWYVIICIICIYVHEHTQTAHSYTRSCIHTRTQNKTKLSQQKHNRHWQTWWSKKLPAECFSSHIASTAQLRHSYGTATAQLRHSYGTAQINKYIVFCK